MAKGYLGAITYKAYLGNIKMKKGYIGAIKVYSAGEVVTYIVGSSRYQEEFEEGQNVLSPKTFTAPPTLSGQVFAGWSLSNGGAVLDNLIMGENPITLYARYVASRVANFGYAGGMQAFKAPYKGLYRFTLLGAGGGGGYSRASKTSTHVGGAGGKTIYHVSLNSGQTVYVGIGGAGFGSYYGYDPTGGYNGGGNGSKSGDACPGGGGGASHLGLSNAVLSSTTVANLLAVAGGGGGGSGGKPTSSSDNPDGRNGGAGGGLSGGNGIQHYSSIAGGAGGTQSSGAAYGRGGGGGAYSGGGGGGYYGGFGGGQSGAGGGGSGYIRQSTTQYKGVNYGNSTTAGAGANGGTGYDFFEPNRPVASNGSAYVDFIAS